MTRPLVITALAGFVASAMCFFIAFSLGGFQWRAWHVDERGQLFDHGWRPNGPPVDGSGPIVTRTLPWKGEEELVMSVPGEVVYVQGPETRVTVTGPKGAADQVMIEDEVLRLARPLTRADGLKVTITAPEVREFTLAGSGRLSIENYAQPRLEVRVGGSGSVRAKGVAKSVELMIGGSGDADLGQVQAEAAEVHIAGSGRATVSPTRKADINIAGSGDVVLTTDPPNLSSHVIGSGAIVRPGDQGGEADPFEEPFMPEPPPGRPAQPAEAATPV